MFEKAKEKLAEAEAEKKGQSWLAEVKDDSGNWKDIEGWVAVYEPPKEPQEESEREKKRKESLKQKAIDLAFEKLQVGIAAKILAVLMEVSSVILSKMALAVSEKNPDLTEMPKLLTSVSAVILSYRFGGGDNDKGKESEKARKCRYLRSQAVKDFTERVRELLPNMTPEEISGQIQVLLDTQKSMVQSLLLEKIDVLLGLANAKMNEKLTNAKTNLDERKEEVVKVVEGVTGGVEQLDQVKDTTDGVLGSVEQKVAAGKDAMFDEFSEMFKRLLLQKMNTVGQTIDQYVHTAVLVIQKDSIVVKEMKDKSPKEVTSDVLAEVEKAYQTAQSRIGEEVQTYLSMAKGLVLNDEGDETE